MEIDHCESYLHDQDLSGLQALEDLRCLQEAAGQCVQASQTESRMRCFLYLFMPDARQPSIYGVFSC